MNDAATETSADIGTATPTELRFESPDGRVWERDVDHHGAPIAPFLREHYASVFGEGLTQCFTTLGAPLAGAAACHIHGWFFLRMIPAGAPDKPGASKPPPDLVLKVLTRLHPELRRRERVARKALADEIWMSDVTGWRDERRSWEDRFATTQRLDTATVPDAELADAIDTAAKDALAMMRRHFELVTPAPCIGLAVLAAAEHGIEAGAVSEALRGSSDATSAPLRALEAIREVLDPAALAGATTLADLRESSPTAAERIDAYLDTFGWRVLGDDVASPTLAESPDVLVRSLRCEPPPVESDADPIATLVAEVPAAARPEVERRLRQAGEAYAMLDDNSAVTTWGLGVLRRLVLDAADRLADRGAIGDARHVWMLEVEEATALLRGADGPTTTEVARRAEDFAIAAAADPPDVVGGDAGAPPDPGLFPDGLGTIAAAVGTYLDLRFPKSHDRGGNGRVEVGGATVATGYGVGDGAVTGRAVVVTSPEEAMDRLFPGDVLVCPVTNPAYNALFPIASAVVTAVGGPLGHTAVTAREIGIPAVVGIGDLDRIPDGAEVTVVGG